MTAVEAPSLDELEAVRAAAYVTHEAALTRFDEAKAARHSWAVLVADAAESGRGPGSFTLGKYRAAREVEAQTRAEWLAASAAAGAAYDAWRAAFDAAHGVVSS